MPHVIPPPRIPSRGVQRGQVAATLWSRLLTSQDLADYLGVPVTPLGRRRQSAIMDRENGMSIERVVT
ncbi:hypothetical protein M408DRAFT_327597 [Serendipita vermifera MAFF 305830]|uniref:Uncharacterized protein n=1 Tax=Serendipita vermifera MAFF 305830 TaxID=933852 RepID=A0A0C3B3F6_SERVB|nr:hypothetical protein M408DRAFT_327597 [Serendipita vermifera MAFF 305830]